jgi:predicted permease
MPFPFSHTDDEPVRVPAWRRYVRFWGPRVEADVDDELAFHLEMRVRDYVARGMSERDARAAASTRLGNLRGARAACLTIGHRRTRRMTRVQTIDALIQDLRYAMRTLVRQMGWTSVAVLTLALGIGASTAVFSVVNSLVLHPLAYAHADRIVSVWRTDAKSHISLSPSTKVAEAWQQQSHAFERIELFAPTDMTMTGVGDATVIHATAVDSDFVKFTGIPMLRGRSFVPAETHKLGVRVAMLSEQLWRDRFGADDDVLGKTIRLDDKPYTVIGVTRSSLQVPSYGDTRTDVWVPFGSDSVGFGVNNIARLKPGQNEAAVVKELDEILTRTNLPEIASTKSFVAELRRPGDMVGFRSSLYLLSGAVALLLLVACANVSHLLLARGATREREIAIRVALGAGRGRLIRQLLTESLILAAIGCAGGVLVGLAGVRALLALRPPSLHQLALTHLDGRAVAVALVVSAITGIAFGFTAAFQAIRRTTADSLRDGTVNGTAGSQGQRLRSFLVITEMAMSAALLVGAVLLIRTVVKLQHVDPGFNVADLYSLKIDLPQSRYTTSQDQRAFATQVLERARHLSTVASADLAMYTPPNVGFMIATLEAEGVPAAGGGAPLIAMNTVDSAYFRLIGARLRGSRFDAGSSDRNEVIINESLAEKLFPGQEAIGKRIRFKPTSTKLGEQKWMQIVGVAGNVATIGLSADRGEPMMYFPVNTHDWPAMTLVVRAKPGSDPTAALRAIVPSLDSRLAAPAVRTVQDQLAETISTQRFTMTLLAVFACLAVLLSAIGLYGVISYVVTQRRREIGIRIALGATPRAVARAVVARGLVLSVLGLAIGLVASVWATKLIKSTLYGVTGTDALSYAATGALLLAVSILACLIPMRRAMAVDPVIAMRGE